ncbi:MAG: DUF938 domain-containing protein [Pseudomonadales bacterium]|nr:DUF938 domain-containing protein [Pseudomonadales bacterium]MBO7007043.1 DUF938 domain-containing protein [Pseudomonadales bacterium]
MSSSVSQNLNEVSAGFKRYNRAADNNKAVILKQLQRLLNDGDRLLEIGSGSGQHAVYVADALKKIQWQPSDRGPYFASLQANLAQVTLSNLATPLYLDVSSFDIPGIFDAVFCANVFHIMPADLIEPMFSGVDRSLSDAGVFVVYGPFKYGGEFTTASNEQFDGWLKSQEAHQGIRDIEMLIAGAAKFGLTLSEDNPMPANNQLLVFRRQSQSLENFVPGA